MEIKTLRRWPARTATLLAWMMFAGLAAAHSPYLLPNQFDLDKRDHVSVQASFTENFFIPDVVMKADDYHVVMPDGTRLPVVPTYTKDLAILDVATPSDGTYRLSTGIRAGRTAKAALLADGTWKFFREQEGPPADGKVHDVTSITCAEVYVSRGAPNDRVLAPTNKGLEFQMQSHPNRLLAGKDVKVRVLYDGKPLAAQTITVQKAGSGDAAPLEIRSGADGVAVLPSAAPGIHHLMTRHRFAVPGESKAESHTYALTLEVAE